MPFLLDANVLISAGKVGLIHRLVEAANGWKKLGNGEASSIAAALADQTLVFVTWDSPACWRALHELGDRVLVGHAWLGLLCSRGLLSPSEANSIATADHRHHPIHPQW